MTDIDAAGRFFLAVSAMGTFAAALMFQSRGWTACTVHGLVWLVGLVLALVATSGRVPW